MTVYYSSLSRLLSCQSFDDDYSDFETKIQDLDRRLATIFCQAFDDCNCMESSAKVGEQRTTSPITAGPASLSVSSLTVHISVSREHLPEKAVGGGAPQGNRHLSVVRAGFPDLCWRLRTFWHRSTKISLQQRAGCNLCSCLCECRGIGSPWDAAAGMGDIWD